MARTLDVLEHDFVGNRIVDNPGNDGRSGDGPTKEWSIHD